MDVIGEESREVGLSPELRQEVKTLLTIR
jgi:hypothetical protein